MQPQIARIFKNGRSQAVRLPEAFRFEEKEKFELLKTGIFVSTVLGATT